MTRALFRLPLALAAAAGLAAPAAAQGPQGKFAAIEVASTAVRAVVIELRPDGTVIDPPAFVGEERTGLIAQVVTENGKRVYPRPALQAVVKAVGAFYTKLKAEQTLDTTRFGVVASSGVVTGADNWTELATLLQDDPTTKPLPRLDGLTVEDEVRLGFLGVVPPDERPRSLFFDIGGSNTKFGFATPAGDKYRAFHGESLGTNTLQRKADEAVRKGTVDAGPVRAFATAAAKVTTDEVVPAIQKKLREIPAAVKGRDRVYVIGGAPYVVATHMFPDKVTADVVQVPYKKVVEYRDKLLAGQQPPYGPLPADPKIAARYNKEAKNIEERFLVNQRLAAVELLDAVFRGVPWEKPAEQEVLFVPNSLYAWQKGYATERFRGTRVGISPEVQEQFAGLAKKLDDLER